MSGINKSDPPGHKCNKAILTTPFPEYSAVNKDGGGSWLVQYVSRFTSRTSRLPIGITSWVSGSDTSRGYSWTPIATWDVKKGGSYLYREPPLTRAEDHRRLWLHFMEDLTFFGFSFMFLVNLNTDIPRITR